MSACRQKTRLKRQPSPAKGYIRLKDVPPELIARLNSGELETRHPDRAVRTGYR